MEPTTIEVILYCCWCSLAIYGLCRLLWALVKAMIEHGNY